MPITAHTSVRPSLRLRQPLKATESTPTTVYFTQTLFPDLADDSQAPTHHQRVATGNTPTTEHTSAKPRPRLRLRHPPKVTANTPITVRAF
jgi:hypothetical protein